MQVNTDIYSQEWNFSPWPNCTKKRKRPIQKYIWFLSKRVEIPCTSFLYCAHFFFSSFFFARFLSIGPLIFPPKESFDFFLRRPRLVRPLSSARCEWREENKREREMRKEQKRGTQVRGWSGRKGLKRGGANQQDAGNKFVSTKLSTEGHKEKSEGAGGTGGERGERSIKACRGIVVSHLCAAPSLLNFLPQNDRYHTHTGRYTHTLARVDTRRRRPCGFLNARRLRQSMRAGQNKTKARRGSKQKGKWEEGKQAAVKWSDFVVCVCVCVSVLTVCAWVSPGQGFGAGADSFPFAGRRRRRVAMTSLVWLQIKLTTQFEKRERSDGCSLKSSKAGV